MDIRHQLFQVGPRAGAVIGRIRRLVVDSLRDGEQAWLLILALVVGVTMGAVAALFRYLIHASHAFFHGTTSGEISFLPMDGPFNLLLRLLLPAFGGLIVGFLVYRLVKIHGGHGMPGVMKAVATGNTHLHPSMAFKSSTSVITMASGGSTGPEGPMAEIGSVVGSMVGQGGQVARDRVATLIGCGAASGVAAIFNAPIGGVFLALELIMRDFAVRTFGPVVLAAVAASVTSQALLPNDPVIETLRQSMVASIQPSFAQVIAFAILGICCGLMGSFFVKTIYRAHDLFAKVDVPMWLKPAVGGLCVGVVGLVLPDVIGEGYAYVNGAILRSEGAIDQPTVQMGILFVAIAFVKILVTAFTLGSGGTGGTFAPAMVTGASLGAGVGVLCHLIVPVPMPAVPVFALVGMAGCVSSVLSLPIAGILIIYEVSGAEYRLVLPLMVCVATSSLVSATMRTGSVYTLSLLRDGFDVEKEHRRRTDPLAGIPLHTIMRRDVTRLRPHDDLAKVLDALTMSLEDDFAVVDDDGKLVGLVSTRDLRGVLTMGEVGQAIIAADAADTSPRVLHPTSTAAEALAIFSATDVSSIPITTSADDRTLEGIVSRYNVLQAYRTAN